MGCNSGSYPPPPLDTAPPSAPANLTATAASATQINLTWTASTDNVGVTGYKVERCTGAACSNFTQVATPTTTTFNDTGLTASTSYSYRVRATDAAGNLSTFSATSTTITMASDTTPPTAPTNLAATAISASQNQPFLDGLDGQRCGDRLQSGTLHGCGLLEFRPDRHAKRSYIQ